MAGFNASFGKDILLIYLFCTILRGGGMPCTPIFGRRGKGASVVADDSPPAFLLVFMGIFSLVCFLGALKVHIALAVVELSLTIVFALLAGAFWEVAVGNANIASSLQTVSTTTLGSIHCPIELKSDYVVIHIRPAALSFLSRELRLGIFSSRSPWAPWDFLLHSPWVTSVVSSRRRKSLALTFWFENMYTWDR